jgi:hypothetical protein
MQIAEKLELPAAHVMACIASRRAESAAAKRYWREAAKLLKDGTWALAVVAVGVLAQNAASPSMQFQTGVKSTRYTLSALGRRARAGDRRRRRRRSARRVTARTADLSKFEKNEPRPQKAF